MKLLFLTCLCLFAGGEREKGLQLYREGRFADAVVAFRAAIAEEGDSAELQWNLALACYGAGDLTEAETAVEKYAAMAKKARPELHAGLLGAVRHAEAKVLEARAETQASGAGAPIAAPGQESPEDPLPVLEQALAKARQASDYFERGALAKATPELLRNTERCLHTIAELERKIEELKKQREQQQDDKKDDNDNKDDKKDDKENKDDKKDDKEKQDEQKSDDKQEQKQDDKSQQKDEKKPEQQKGSEQEGDADSGEKPEPRSDGKPEPKPDAKEGKDDKSQPSEGKQDGEPPPKPEQSTGEQKPRHDAPGEAVEGKELTPEQAQRLLEQLQTLDDKLKSIRARAKSGRRPVERDW